MKTPVETAIRPAGTPRILLVEDDPTSRAFLTAAVRAIPAEVDSADSLAAAWTLADARRYDLWLFDSQLPDGSGSELLARLRARDEVDHPRVPALAHTASVEPGLSDALVAAGFDAVLVKPLPASALQSAVRRVLGLPLQAPVVAAEAPGGESGEPPLWDDEAAARTLNFNRGHIDILRGLFVDELPHARQQVLAAARAGDHDAMRASLHKLRAGCGFVGAAWLAAVVEALQRQPGDAALLARFDQAARDTVAPSHRRPVESGLAQSGSQPA